MKDIHSINYSALDIPEIVELLFYPRKETGWPQPGTTFDELAISTPDGVHIGGRWYCASNTAPSILFFHGNGEIVEDYGDLAAIYMKFEINFMPFDYRGYGRSTGKPSVTSMMRDCHAIYSFAKEFLSHNNITGPLFIMGRSLGSASAIELASEYGSEIGGLIIESGFANIVPLLQLLGVNIHTLGITEADCPNNAIKISQYHGPLLVIHAEKDHIIPFAEGKTLFDACPSRQKQFLEIKRANHNNIFQLGMSIYFNAIAEFIADVK